MKKSTKIWLAVATALTLAGLLLFVGTMTACTWDFSEMSSNSTETTRHEITDPFQNITVVTDTADIRFLPAEESVPSVVCKDQKNLRHAVTVQDGTLTIEIRDTRKWYEHISLYGENTAVTVYLPLDSYGALTIDASTSDIEIPADFTFSSVEITLSTGDILCRASASDSMKIKTSTGDIRLENLSAASLDLKVTTGHVTAANITVESDMTLRVSTGKANLTDVTCQNFTSSGGTGDLNMERMTARGAFTIERSTGDVKFKDCDAGEITVTCDTGDVTGSLLSEKVFFTQTDTGDIRVPATTSGGTCKITTDTGDIRITVVGAD